MQIIKPCFGIVIIAAVTERIGSADRSGGLYRILESSLYPSLYRLVEKGMISDHSEKVGKRRVRVYYHLEEQGRKYLEDLKHEYILHTAGVLKILQVDNIEEIANGIE